MSRAGIGREIVCSAAVLLVMAHAVSPAVAGAPLSNAAGPLAICEETIREGAIDLESEARREISACLTRGIECLVDAPAAREACCRRAHDFCENVFSGLDGAKRQFATRIRERRCSTVPFASIIDPTGLGYGNIAAACGALAPAGAVDDLGALVDCLARLVVARTACRIGTQEEPRGLEALTCADFEAGSRSATDSDLHACGAPVPSPSPTPPPPPCVAGQQVVAAVSLTKTYAGANVDLAYPSSVVIPGTGNSALVTQRVSFVPQSGLTSVNDHDTNADTVDDMLTAGFAGLDENDPGTFVTVAFDCIAGSNPPAAADFSCSVTSASTSGGVLIPDEQCAVAVQ